MFQSLFGSLLNHLYPYANENVSVRHLSLICITSILTTIYSLKNWTVYEDLAVNKTLNHSGSFGKNFVKFEEKDKNIIHQPKVSTALGLLSRAVLKTSGTVYPNTDLPAGK